VEETPTSSLDIPGRDSGSCVDFILLDAQHYWGL
jgi:hypothetical protein